MLLTVAAVVAANVGATIMPTTAVQQLLLLKH